MAGLGRKDFEAGQVLSAADVNGYLMDQSVQRFASAAARDTAIPTPSEGMVCYLDDVNQIELYNGSAWVDQQSPLLSEGTAGQYLQSNGAAGSQWVTSPSPDDLITTQGDLIIGGVTGDASRIAIGAADTVLTSNGTTATWSAGGGGSGINFVNLNFQEISNINVNFPINTVINFIIVTTSTADFSFSLFDSGDNKVGSMIVNRDRNSTYFTNSNAVSKIAFAQDIIDETVTLIFTDPVEVTPATSQIDFIKISVTQSITLTKSFNAYIFGAGGGGGGGSGSGGGGGGSGFLSISTLAAGTYTATIGAGGGGNFGNVTGSAGGASSINSVVANGGGGGIGSGGTASGGNGGSGGGGGSGDTSETSFGIGGFNGGNGGSAASRVNGGSGSGSLLPTSSTEEVLTFSPGSRATIKSTGGGFYEGGSGGIKGVNQSGSAGLINGGGGGASSVNNIFGGSGGNGVIFLIEVV